MLELHDHGVVTRAEFSTPRTRLVGYSVSVYLVDGVLIDAAFPAIRKEFGRWVESVRPAGALITHKHEDHAGNVSSLAKLGVPVGMAVETLAALRDPGPIGMYRKLVWQKMRPLRRELTPFDAPQLQLIPTPGHSPDHHAVWDAERRILFGGDLFLGVKVRVAHPGESPRDLARSVRSAAALSPLHLFDAHRGEIKTPVAALTAKAGWIEDMIAAIDARIDAGDDDETIRDELLGGEEIAGYFSLGDYSRGNFVRSVRRTRGS
jgi:glyoxylase-like metal-dependent hydrolase (beta-lactamase superfamily II)